MSLILAKSKIGKHICVFLQEQQGQNYQRQSGWEQCHVGTGALVLGGELARAFKHPMQVETSFTLNILTFENYRNDQKKKKVLCHWKKSFFFLRNIFVSRHDSDALIVKLGDAGIPDYSDPAEIHFLAIEMFTSLNHKSCTTKGWLTNTKLKYFDSV